MLLDTVRKTIKEYRMLEKGDKVLCAVSGGADSVCLLHVILSLRDEYNLSVYVANINHLIRGEEADRDSSFVKDICEKEGVRLFYREYDVPKIAKKEKLGEEECGRKLRYEFFEEISEALGGVKIATAHNLNDNAETVLFRLARGTSAQGLGGIKYKRENIIRPLLDVARNEIEEYLSNNSLSWCEDSTNNHDIYSRNKIRLSIVPRLREIAPDTERKIVSASKLIREDDEFLSQCSHKIIDECVFDEFVFLEPVKDLHISLKRRVVHSVLEKWKTKEITTEKINSFIELFTKENGKSFDIDETHFAEKSYDRIILRKREIKKEFSEILDLNRPIHTAEWALELEILYNETKRKGNDEAIFDADKLTLPLTVRYRREGDRISQKGILGTKKLSDIFTDEKIERQLRDVIPVVTQGDNVLFLCGLRQSSLYGVDKNTKNYLVIKYRKNS